MGMNGLGSPRGLFVSALAERLSLSVCHSLHLCLYVSVCFFLSLSHPSFFLYASILNVCDTSD